MATLRSQMYAGSAPSTNFNLYADLISTEAPGVNSTHGRWLVRVYIQGVNTGNTYSHSNYWGQHYGYVRQASSGGWSLITAFSDNPFIRSGAYNGAERWIRGYDVWIYANSQGYVRDSSTTLDLLQEVWTQDPDWLSPGTPEPKYKGKTGSISLPRINQAPSEPLNLRVTSRTSNAVGLTWDPPASNGGSAVTEYVIQYSKDPSYLTSSTLTSQSTSVTLPGLDLTNYYVRVSAKSALGTGPATASLTVSPVQRPSIPRLLYVSATSASITVNAANGDYIGDGVLERRLERSLQTDFTSVTPVTVASLGDTTDTGLVRGTEYHYRYRVRNSEGWSDWVYLRNLRTKAVPPSAPSGYSVIDVGSTTAYTTIPVVSNNGGGDIVSTRVQVSTSADVAGLLLEKTVPEYRGILLTGLTPGQVHYFRMAVANSGDGGGWSGYGPWVSFTAKSNVPTHPLNLRAEDITDFSARAEWDPPASLLGAVQNGYTIRFAHNVTFSDGLRTLFAASADTSRLFTGLLPGTDYYMQIRAESSNGPGSWSEELKFTTTGVAPISDEGWLHTGGTWRSGRFKLRVGGTWRSGVLWMMINGTWRKH